jgi:hypothetical protein
VTVDNLPYRLVEAFRNTFAGQPYYHRNQTIGNFVASHLYEDLSALGRSPGLIEGIRSGRFVVNTANIVKGRRGRRGDGTFGDLIPGEDAQPETGFTVLRGPLATILIGAEVKILAKAMMKQIDRVMTDLESQAKTFRAQNNVAICVGLVGVNCSDSYTSYEGDRSYPAKPSPAREAPEAVSRLRNRVTAAFDELLVLRFKATNVPPYPFAWVDEREVRQQYGAALLRISELFDTRATRSQLGSAG